MDINNYSNKKGFIKDYVNNFNSKHVSIDELTNEAEILYSAHRSVKELMVEIKKLESLKKDYSRNLEDKIFFDLINVQGPLLSKPENLYKYFLN